MLIDEKTIKKLEEEEKMIKCIRCDWKIDPKYFIAYKNIQGLKENLLSHIRNHEEQDKISNYFQDVPIID